MTKGNENANKNPPPTLYYNQSIVYTMNNAKHLVEQVCAIHGCAAPTISFVSLPGCEHEVTLKAEGFECHTRSSVLRLATNEACTLFIKSWKLVTVEPELHWRDIIKEQNLVYANNFTSNFMFEFPAFNVDVAQFDRHLSVEFVHDLIMSLRPGNRLKTFGLWRNIWYENSGSYEQAIDLLGLLTTSGWLHDLTEEGVEPNPGPQRSAQRRTATSKHAQKQDRRSSKKTDLKRALSEAASAAVDHSVAGIPCRRGAKCPFGADCWFEHPDAVAAPELRPSDNSSAHATLDAPPDYEDLNDVILNHWASVQDYVKRGAKGKEKLEDFQDFQSPLAVYPPALARRWQGTAFLRNADISGPMPPHAMSVLAAGVQAAAEFLLDIEYAVVAEDIPEPPPLPQDTITGWFVPDPPPNPPAVTREEIDAMNKLELARVSELETRVSDERAFLKATFGVKVCCPQSVSGQEYYPCSEGCERLKPLETVRHHYYTTNFDSNLNLWWVKPFLALTLITFVIYCFLLFGPKPDGLWILFWILEWFQMTCLVVILLALALQASRLLAVQILARAIKIEHNATISTTSRYVDETDGRTDQASNETLKHHRSLNANYSYYRTYRASGWIKNVLPRSWVDTYCRKIVGSKAEKGKLSYELLAQLLNSHNVTDWISPIDLGKRIDATCRTHQSMALNRFDVPASNDVPRATSHIAFLVAMSNRRIYKLSLPSVVKDFLQAHLASERSSQVTQLPKSDLTRHRGASPVPM